MRSGRSGCRVIPHKFRRVPSTKCVHVDIEEAPSVRYENVTKCFIKYGERCNTVYDTVLEEVPRTVRTDVSRRRNVTRFPR